eukprot:2627248-Prymnesium_polylepis.1
MRTCALACLLLSSAAALVPASAPLRARAGGRAWVVRAQLQPDDDDAPPDAAAWLADGETAPATADVLLSLFAACRQVAASIATASCDSFACFNEVGSAGTEEVAIDLLAEQVLFDRLAETGRVAVASSESDKVMRPLCADGTLAVTLDPIDASSIMDTNFAVGSSDLLRRNSNPCARARFCGALAAEF